MRLGIVLILLICAQAIYAQKIIYVDSSAIGANNGLSWDNAFVSLDSALNRSGGFGDEDAIFVAKGTYRPSQIPRGAVWSGDNRDYAFHFPKAGVIYGGFPSGGGQRDAKRNPTILDGDVGQVGVTGDNVYHVVIVIDAEIEIDGFIVRNGTALGQGDMLIDGTAYSRNAGAGFMIKDAEFIGLTSMVVESNNAMYGAGIFSKNSYVSAYNSFISGNLAYEKGGGIMNDTAAVLGVINSVVVNNQSFYGGGIYNNLASLVIRHSTFVKNQQIIAGGAIYNLAAIECRVHNSIFSLNGREFGPGNIAEDDISEEIAGTSTTEVYFSAMQIFRGMACVYATDAQLLNADDPDGPDNIFGTPDDGLMPTAQSSAFNIGLNGTEDEDILGIKRNTGGPFDVGAYEIDPCGRLTSRTVYIDSAISNGNSGNSWTEAFSSLQAGINLAQMGCIDTIKVAMGSYRPVATPREWEGSSAGGQYAFTFHLPDNVVIIGGYAPGGNDRNPDIYATKITKDPYNYSNAPLMIAINVNNVVVDGFQFLESKLQGHTSMQIASKVYRPDAGAALFISGSSIEIRNAKFINNHTTSVGGAVYAENSTVKIDRSYFEKNQCNVSYESSGGAVYYTNSKPGSYIRHSKFVKNKAGYFGGAVAFYQCVNQVVIDSCTFIQNLAESYAGNVVGGGAVSTRERTSLLLLNSIFSENRGHLGGAVNLSHGTIAYINRCYFERDTAFREGGAISIRGANEAHVGNSVFVENVAPVGGAIEVQNGSTILASTFYKNKATVSGGAINIAASMNLFGSVFWKNQLNGSETDPGADLLPNSLFAASGNAFQASTSKFLTSNFHALDPLFADESNPLGADNTFGTADDGLRLGFGSPLLNEVYYGNAFAPIFRDKDAKGDDRADAGVSDVGAYEFAFCDFSNFINRTVYVDSAVQGGNNSGNSWANAFRTLEEALKVSRLSCAIDTIKIAKGTYKPTAAPGLNPLTSQSIPWQFAFTWRDSLEVIGGFPSGGGDRNVAYNSTVLQGNTIMSGLKNISLDGLTLEKIMIDVTNSSFSFSNLTIREVIGDAYRIKIAESNGRVVNTVFENIQAGDFGAIRQENSTVTYMNCVFWKNVTSGMPASCLFLSNSEASLINCTFFRNSLNFGAVVSIGQNTKLNCYNSVFWGNRANFSHRDPFWHEIYLDGANMNNIQIRNSLFEYAPTTSTLHASNQFGIYPNFADSSSVKGEDGFWRTADDGLRLLAGSPALNSGDNSFVPAGIATDITGTRRICGGTVDRGGYEFDCLLGGRISNKLVTLGSVETAIDTVDNCGTEQYFESQVTSERYIALIDANGNSISSSSVIVNASTIEPHIKSDGFDTTAVSNRMLSIVAPGRFTVNGGVTVRFYYDPEEFAHLPKYARKWFKHPGHSKAEVLSDLQVNGLNNAIMLEDIEYGTENGIAFVDFKNITGFSTFGLLATNIGQALPVEFLSFNARRSGVEKVVHLDWATGNEVNNDRFIIERSPDGLHWKAIATVDGRGTYSGTTHYSYSDSDPELPRSYYRIRQVDFNGHETHTSIRQIVFDDQQNNEYVMAPNPAANFVDIRFAKEQSVIELEFLGMDGRRILRLIYENKKLLRLNLEKMSSGLYILKVNGVASKLVIRK